MVLNNKKINWIIIFISVLMIVVVSFLYFNNGISSQDVGVTGQNICNGLEGDDIENCFLALESKDVSLCDGTLSKSASGECYTAIAIDNNDISICDSKEDGDFKATCFTSFSMKNKDASLCDKAGGSKLDCITSVAVAYNDISICGSYEDAGFIEYCSQTVEMFNKNIR